MLNILQKSQAMIKMVKKLLNKFREELFNK